MSLLGSLKTFLHFYSLLYQVVYFEGVVSTPSYLIFSNLPTFKLARHYADITEEEVLEFVNIRFYQSRYSAKTHFLSERNFLLRFANLCFLLTLFKNNYCI